MAVQSTLSTRAEELNFLVHDWIPKRKRTVQTLREVADKLMAHHKNVCIAKSTGSSASLVGFVLVAVGFGLSFVTLGSSLILSAVGGGICAAGGLTTTGSSITEVCIQKDSYKTAQKIFDEDREAMETVEKLRGELEEEAKEGGEASFRGLSAAGRVAHVGGFAFSAVLLPLDIYTLVTSAREIDAARKGKKDEEPEAVKNLRMLADELEKELRDKEELARQLDNCISEENRVPKNQSILMI